MGENLLYSINNTKIWGRIWLFHEKVHAHWTNGPIKTFIYHSYDVLALHLQKVCPTRDHAWVFFFNIKWESENDRKRMYVYYINKGKNVQDHWKMIRFNRIMVMLQSWSRSGRIWPPKAAGKVNQPEPELQCWKTSNELEKLSNAVQ